MSRAAVSLRPPAANGTMMRTTWLGKFCARAAAAARRTTAASAATPVADFARERTTDAVCHMTISSVLLLKFPAQAFSQTAAHDPIEIVGGDEVELLGKMRHALPVAAMLQHAREVGAPERAPRTERLDHAAERFLEVAERIGLAREA